MDNSQVIQSPSSSAEIVKNIFNMHMPFVKSVFDLTYGNGTFWTCFEQTLIQYDPGLDFRNTGKPFCSYDCVVFDPPFTANGPMYHASTSETLPSHNARYGADRSQANAPKNIHEVRSLLASGLIEAMRISSRFVLVKTQDVVESGKLHSSTELVQTLFRLFGFRVVDYVLYNAPRRPQPDIERGSVLRHFRNRPSVFYLGERK